MKKDKVFYYLRQPSLSSNGKQIAFGHGGDIWTVPAKGGSARRITAHASFDSNPIFSPDDRYLAFGSLRSGGGNIYIASLESGDPPRRLTYHQESTPPSCWSPDGNWIYFTSNYDGISGAIYKVHIEGGTSIRIASDPLESHYHVAISPDAKKIAFNNNGDAWWRRGPNPPGHSDIWIMKESGNPGSYRKLTRYLGRNLRPMWDSRGTGLYFLSDRDGWENIWYMTLRGDARPLQITNFADGRVLRPSISADGRWIVFERDFQIWLLNLEDRTAGPVNIRVHSDEKSNAIRYHTYRSGVSEFRLSPDGKKAAFIVRGSVFADLADKGDKSKKAGPSFKVTGTPFRESQLNWDTNSARVVYVSDRSGHNEIFLYDFKTRTEKQLTDSPKQKYCPTFSPDGKWLAYVQGNHEIWLMNTGNEEKYPLVTGRLFTEVPEPTELQWSPDSKWLAFVASDEHFFNNIYVQHIEEKTPRQISFLSNIDCYQVLWSPDGKFIIFNTGHFRSENQIARIDLKPIPPVFREEEFDKLFQEDEEKKKEEQEKEQKKKVIVPSPEESASPEETSTPPSASDTTNHHDSEGDSSKSKAEDKEKEIEPVEIIFEGIKQRLSFLTDFKLDAAAKCIRPDNKTLIFGAMMTGDYNLWSMPLDEDRRGEQPTQLTSSSRWKGYVQFLPDGKKFYYLDGGRIYSLGMNESGGKKGGTDSLDIEAELEINFHAEKLQIFKEAWQMIHDHFYDPEFHGCDWNKMYQRFYPLVEKIQTDIEFRELLNLMLGELNASHLGAYGWAGGAPDSFLGVEFDRNVLEKKGHYKVGYILPDSPLTLSKDPPMIGEYLVEIDGVALNGRIDIAVLLQRKEGKRVKLKLNKRPRRQGAREVTVRPIDYHDYHDLRYGEWVRQNVHYVNRKSQGRLGYVHIPSMSYEDYLNFIADLDTEAHNKDGVIIDVRFNSGGHVAPFILDVLYRKAYTRSSYRGMINTTDTNISGSRIFEKPVILVTNEHSGSNAEMFSEGFRRLGLGKVIGMPTAGAVIWTWGWRLLDGTLFRLPRLKVATLEGENTESTARPVDVEVDRLLGETQQGKDSQLDVAVKELLAQIDGIG